MNNLGKLAAALGTVLGAIVLFATAASAQAVDVGTTVAPVVTAVTTGMFSAIAQVLPIVIPALIAFAVIGGVVAWLRKSKKLTGA